MATTAVPPKPKSWPKDIDEKYEAIKPLGKGAFGLVWLAKSKKTTSKSEDAYVAIKHIKVATESERAYAEREISILQELDHPCIIRLVQACEPQSPTSKSRLVVMSLANGPDLGNLISMGGALSLPLARLISRHLISAVSYCHGRGVLHRDLKPDNCILARKDVSPETAASIDDLASDDTLWYKTGDNESFEHFNDKWKLVLVDFGFARALSPRDVLEEGGGKTNKRMRNSIINEGEAVAVAAKLALVAGDKQDAPEEAKGQDVPKPLPSKVDRRSAGRASMATMNFKMSALGTRAFAAPEIKNKARMQDEKESSALTDHVADYGMISDAFSVGVTLRTVLTGVPADEANVTEYISSQNNPLAQLLSAIFGACASKDGKVKRKKQYRYLSALPKDASTLLSDLTKAKAEDRITVRQAQNNDWICGSDEEQYIFPQGDYPSTTGTPINFLKCASKE